ncbi:MAG: hypothetical protein IKD58_15010 [Loktanella sp.]|nr:hypothetical protein [Loktanella sp.]
MQRSQWVVRSITPNAIALLVAWPLTIIMLKGQLQSSDNDQGRYFWSPLKLLNAVALLFFLNAASPYMGLKTAQSMNMFANLRLEGGISNHLVFSGAPGPFKYLEDLVIVDAAETAPRLEWIAQQEDLALVYYHFLSMLSEQGPDAEVAYSRAGRTYSLTPATLILEEDGHMLHSDWVRKFFHFRMVDLNLPLPCEFS